MTRPAPTATLCVAVTVGGAVGALLRWWLDVRVPNGDGFPWTTLAINVSGSFVLAALPALAVVRRHPVLPPALGTGVCGGYTTFSAYAEQGRALVADGRLALAAAYLLGTLGACVVAVLLAERLSSPAALREFADEEGFE